MNKSIFGQLMASAILVIPMVIFGWLVFSPHSAGVHNDGTITSVATWMFSAMLIVAALYFAIATYMTFARKEKFKIIASTPNGKPRFAVSRWIKGRFISYPDTVVDGIKIPGEKSWWAKKDTETQKRFSLVALSVVAILVAYPFLPKEAREKATENPYFWAGVVALLGVHLIWFMFPKKGSWIEVAVLYGIIFFYSITLIFPQVIGIRNAGMSIAGKALTDVEIKAILADANYEKTQATQPAQQAVTTVVSQPKLISVELAIPADATITAVPPEGHRLSSVRCPSENVMELTDWATHKVRQIDCAGRLTLEEDDLRNKEIAFFQKPGGSVPSMVIVRWVKV